MSSSADNPVTSSETKLPNLSLLHKLAVPLYNKKGKDSATICEEFEKILEESADPVDKEEAKVWKLMRMLNSNSVKIPDRYTQLVIQSPEYKRYVVLLSWLEILKTNDQIPSDDLEKTLYYLRSGQISELFKTYKLKGIGWMNATIAGAFSHKDYKLWRSHAKTLLKSNKLSKEETTLYSILSGELDACLQVGSTYFDKLWAHLTSILCSALAGEHPDRSIPEPPEDSGVLDRSAYDIFTNGPEAVASDETLPRRLRIHTAAAFGHPEPALVESVMDEMLAANLPGGALFYASLAPQGAAIELLAGVISGLPEPDAGALSALQAHSLRVPAAAVVVAAVDRIISASPGDFDPEPTAAELADRKIAALGWLELVEGARGMAEFKLRKLLGHFVRGGQFAAAQRLLDLRRGVLTNNAEREAWAALVTALDRLDALDRGEAVPSDAIAAIRAVLQFPRGWMRGAPFDVELGREVIPRLAARLLELYTATGDYINAFSVFPLIADPQKDLARFLTPEAALDILRRAKAGTVIEMYKRNYTK